MSTKFCFATHEDCFVKVVAETTLSEGIYEHKEDSDFLLFVFDNDMSNEDFKQHYKKCYAHLDFEVLIEEAEESVEQKFKEDAMRLLSEKERG